MPVKRKQIRSDIIKAAFQIIKEKGIEAVTEAELSKRLGTEQIDFLETFKGMDELKQELRKLAMKQFESYISGAVKYSPAFKYVGLKMVQFAKEEPKLFRFLYMQEHNGELKYEELMMELGDTVEICLAVMEKAYTITREEAERLFRQVWLHTFAICVLVATKTCSFTEEEVSQMLSLEFQGAIMLIKSGAFQVKEIHRIS